MGHVRLPGRRRARPPHRRGRGAARGHHRRWGHRAVVGADRLRGRAPPPRPPLGRRAGRRRTSRCVHIARLQVLRRGAGRSAGLGTVRGPPLRRRRGERGREGRATWHRAAGATAGHRRGVRRRSHQPAPRRGRRQGPRHPRRRTARTRGVGCRRGPAGRQDLRVHPHRTPGVGHRAHREARPGRPRTRRRPPRTRDQRAPPRAPPRPTRWEDHRPVRRRRHVRHHRHRHRRHSQTDLVRRDPRTRPTPGRSAGRGVRVRARTRPHLAGARNRWAPPADLADNPHQ